MGYPASLPHSKAEITHTQQMTALSSEWLDNGRLDFNLGLNLEVTKNKSHRSNKFGV